MAKTRARKQPEEQKKRCLTCGSVMERTEKKDVGFASSGVATITHHCPKCPSSSGSKTGRAVWGGR
ncbi:MAG: hypothetical protein PHU42_00225 [Patescibacteria group bacterium]|nr:hypothetical protein [Patescibacteria group bacterium]